MSNIITYKFRIKDSVSRKYLCKMAGSVNFVWNHAQELSLKALDKDKKFLTKFELNNLTAGMSHEVKLHSQTIQAINEEYATKRKQFKKRKLNWRTAKRSLGWIPFKASALKLNNDTVRYNKRTFKFWKSREIQGKIKCGSFVQDSQKKWYICLVCEIDDNTISDSQLPQVAIDPGLKDILTLSDGKKFSRENITKKYEKKLAIAQRAKKKKQVTAIHARIKNSRKDWLHKTTTEIVKSYSSIFIGDVSSKKLMKTRIAKSIADAGWGSIKSLLEYKAKKLGKDFKEINESWTSITCSCCNERSGPSGLSGLSVRYWTCSKCNTSHDRDVNAAMNILNIGLGHKTPIKGIPHH